MISLTRTACVQLSLLFVEYLCQIERRRCAIRPLNVNVCMENTSCCERILFFALFALTPMWPVWGNVASMCTRIRLLCERRQLCIHDLNRERCIRCRAYEWFFGQTYPFMSVNYGAERYSATNCFAVYMAAAVAQSTQPLNQMSIWIFGIICCSITCVAVTAFSTCNNQTVYSASVPK